MNTVFHEGELAVQQRVGVEQMAARVGNSIKPTIPPAAANFLQERPFVIISTADENGQLWASILVGEVPFMKVLDERTIYINNALPTKTDRLTHILATGTQVGLIAIEFETRRRMRVNGTLKLLQNSLLIHTEQVYANCPKYIQARLLSEYPNGEHLLRLDTSHHLTAEQSSWVQDADTFFIASAAPGGGADASHRGGNKGFVRVEDDNHLIWPDYAGNMMFNTLGNIALNPKIGLLFIDFEGNRTLQLTGRAEIVWEEAQIAQFAGAERLVRFRVDAVIETQNALPFAWTFDSYSSANPM
jgi:predicted pyridoxine 5'-phosphate oxidase superfamily flavin-nucleotide-binding protein